MILSIFPRVFQTVHFPELNRQRNMAQVVYLVDFTLNKNAKKTDLVVKVSEARM